jgi:acyl-coenzyme A thioesterase PaaI-like protein
MVPYSGTIHPLVLELEPGYARVQIKDRRSVRNHLESVHAIALMNVAEMATGLAMMFGLPDDARAIITRLSIDYLKKARGTLVAEFRCAVPQTNERAEYDFASDIRDESGEIVARAQARWLVGPAP